MEIESFVHGALCYCYSGQCLMSSMIGGRSGNRGRCAQPCRLPYQVYRDGKRLNNDRTGYALSPKDMCTVDILPEIIEAGVYSLKIEGRMKNRNTLPVWCLFTGNIWTSIFPGKKGRSSPKRTNRCCGIFITGMVFTRAITSSETDGP